MTMTNSRAVASGLMLLSGVTHVVQLFIYGAHGHVVGAALFGLAYFGIGLGLRGTSRWALWLGAVLPSIGGVLGVVRYTALHANPFSVFHVGIDLVVVPICVWLLLRERPHPQPA